MSWELNKERARGFLGDPSTSATVLHVIVLKTYGIEYIYGSDEQDPVDPIILWNELEQDYRISIPIEVENKINAMMTAVSTDYFFTNKQVFSAVCTSISTGDLGDPVNGEFDTPTVSEMLRAVQEVDLNDGDRDATFSPEVRNFIAHVFDSENVDTDDEVDWYTADADEHMQKMSSDLQSLGIPPEQTVLPAGSDMYGLLPPSQ